MSTYRHRGTDEIRTWRIGDAGDEWGDLMRVVWRNGELLVRDSLAVIRGRAAQAV